MRGFAAVLATGAAAVVLWKIFAVLFFGLLGMAMKVGLVVLVVWFVMKLINGKKDKAEA